MGFKDFFLRPSDKVEDAKPKSSKPQSVNVTPKVITDFSQPTSAAVTSTEYQELIEKMLVKRDQPGPDFFEMFKSLQQMDAVPLAEDQKYKLVFQTLATSGLTKDKLLSSAKLQLTGLDEELADFQKVASKVSKEEVNDRKAEIETLAKETIDLNQKIQANNSKIAELNGLVMASQLKIDQQTNKFTTGIAMMKAKIEEIISKTINYIQ